jgi:hypothetical protein
MALLGLRLIDCTRGKPLAMAKFERLMCSCKSEMAVIIMCSQASINLV